MRIFFSLLILVLLTSCVSNTLEADDPKSQIYSELKQKYSGISAQELMLAGDAEFNALENGAVAVPVIWNAKDGNSGSVTPGQAYKVGTSTCRRYQRQITNNGLVNSTSATACKDKDGIWSPVE